MTGLGRVMGECLPGPSKWKRQRSRCEVRRAERKAAPCSGCALLARLCDLSQAKAPSTLHGRCGPYNAAFCATPLLLVAGSARRLPPPAACLAHGAPCCPLFPARHKRLGAVGAPACGVIPSHCAAPSRHAWRRHEGAPSMLLPLLGPRPPARGRAPLVSPTVTRSLRAPVSRSRPSSRGGLLAARQSAHGGGGGWGAREGCLTATPASRRRSALCRPAAAPAARTPARGGGITAPLGTRPAGQAGKGEGVERGDGRRPAGAPSTQLRQRCAAPSQRPLNQQPAGL